MYHNVRVSLFHKCFTYLNSNNPLFHKRSMYDNSSKYYFTYKLRNVFSNYAFARKITFSSFREKLKQQQQRLKGNSSLKPSTTIQIAPHTIDSICQLHYREHNREHKGIQV